MSIYEQLFFSQYDKFNTLGGFLIRLVTDFYHQQCMCVGKQPDKKDDPINEFSSILQLIFTFTLIRFSGKCGNTAFN